MCCSGETTPFAWISNGTSARDAGATITGTACAGGRAAFFEHAASATRECEREQRRCEASRAVNAKSMFIWDQWWNRA